MRTKKPVRPEWGSLNDRRTVSLCESRTLAAASDSSVSGSVIAAPQVAIGGTEILLGLLANCWIGFPLLLLVALVWQLVQSFIASLRRPLPVIRAPDTDLMA